MAAPCCHRCGAPLPAVRPSRRDACDACGADTRVCRNCVFFAPGSHNDCREPGAERVPDKERANFCEYFAWAAAPETVPGSASDGARAALDALFRKG